MPNNRFTRGLGHAPLFVCLACKRKTRRSTDTNGSSEMCSLCDERYMIENGIVDNNLQGEALAFAEAELTRLANAAIKKGGVITPGSPGVPAVKLI